MATVDDSVAEMKKAAQDAVDTLIEYATAVWGSVMYTPLPGPVPDPATVDMSSERAPTVSAKPTWSFAGLNGDQLDQFTNRLWNDNLSDIETFLKENLITGGPGFSADLQDAIFNSDRERKMQTLSDAMDLAGARTGARGFRYPNSMTKAAQNELLQKYQFDQENQSREITKLMAELAQKNFVQSVDFLWKYEAFHADFTMKYASLWHSVLTSSLEKYRQDVAYLLSTYEGEIRLYAAQLDVLKADAQLSQANMELLSHQFNADADRTKHGYDLALEQILAQGKERTAALAAACETYAKLLAPYLSGDVNLRTGKIA